MTNSIVFYSKKLKRDILAKWEGDNPKIVYLDDLPFTTDEIAILVEKKPDAKTLQSILDAKEIFGGTLTKGG